MKYTKNLHNKLLLKGYRLISEVEESEDEYIKYSLYQKGVIDVIVCDSHKEVDIMISAEEFDVSHLNLQNLSKLENLLHTPGRCIYCGCTDGDCSKCIEKTGEACYWVDNEHTVCSACK